MIDSIANLNVVIIVHSRFRLQEMSTLHMGRLGRSKRAAVADIALQVASKNKIEHSVINLIENCR